VFGHVLLFLWVVFFVFDPSFVFADCLGDDFVPLHSVVKTSTETVNNSTVLQNDDELFFSYDASAIYDFDLTLYYTIKLSSDLKFGFLVGDVTDLRWSFYSQMGSSYNYASSSVYSLTVGSDQTDRVLTVHGTFRSGSAGTINFQWAQNTAISEDTQILQKSYIVFRRLDDCSSITFSGGSSSTVSCSTSAYNQVCASTAYNYSTTSTSTLLSADTVYTLPLAGYYLLFKIFFFIWLVYYIARRFRTR